MPTSWLRALLLLCAVSCGLPFLQMMPIVSRRPVRSCARYVREAAVSCGRARGMRCVCASARSMEGDDSDEVLGHIVPPYAQGTGPPKRLPPAGASTFWDRESSSARAAVRASPAFDPPGAARTEVLVLGASRAHSATVIWLHGNAGDPPRGWLRMLAKLNMPWCKFLMPVAASRHPPLVVDAEEHEHELGVGSGLLEPTMGWADDQSAAADAPESLWTAVDMVHDLIDREVQLGVQADKVIVGGFGQGAAVALLASLTYRRQLAGVASFSGYLPPSLLRPAAKAGRVGGLDVSVAAAYLPVLMCHGSRDGVVPLMSGLATYKALVSMGTRPSFRSLQGVGHGVSGDMLAMLRLFLLSHVGPQWPGGLGMVAEGDTERVLQSLSVSEILDFLHARNIDTQRCARKSDLLALAARALPAARTSVRTSARASAARPQQFGWEGFLDNNVPMNPPPFDMRQARRGERDRTSPAWRVGVERAAWAGGEGVDEAEASEGMWDKFEKGGSAASRAFAEWRAGVSMSMCVCVCACVCIARVCCTCVLRACVCGVCVLCACWTECLHASKQRVCLDMYLDDSRVSRHFNYTYNTRVTHIFFTFHFSFSLFHSHPPTHTLKPKPSNLIPKT